MSGTVSIDWRTMRSGLVRFLAKRTGCAVTAEDLAQDLWFRLNASDSNAAEIRNPTAYVFKVAANAAFDWRKRETRAVGVAWDETIADRCADDRPSPERLAQAQQTNILLQQAIEALPPKCREAFVLCRIDGLTMRAAGERLGVSERTIENHLVRATRECRQRLVDAGAWP